jgi:FkbH-like protein
MTRQATEILRRLVRGDASAAPGAGQLASLLRSIEDAGDLDVAGSLLRQTDYERLKELLPGKDIQEIRIALIGCLSLTSTDNVLNALLARDAIVPRFFVGGYNQHQFELLNQQSDLYGFAPEIAVCFLDEKIIASAYEEINTPEEFELKSGNSVSELTLLAEKFHQYNTGLLIFNTVPINTVWADTIIDYQNKARFGRIWRNFNSAVLALAEFYPRVVVLDSDPLVQRLKGEYREERLNDYAGISYSDELMAQYAKEIAKIARTIKGKVKKCLVVDLDNTLWGGVVGEDLVDGIRISPEGQGKPFHKFQNAIRSLSQQGVLLAVNSKNDADVVDEVFQKRPDMILRKEDFLVVKANWRDKASNMREIAAELNIGTDSLVFVDDQPFERESVKNNMPEVEVIDIGAEESDYTKVLMEKGFFNVLSLTVEDRLRVGKYQSERRRGEFLVESADYHDYLRGLQIQVNMIVPSAEMLSRFEQLELRTNQFNMTTRRYTKSMLEDWAASDRYILRGMEAKDRFGHYGIVGSILIEKYVENDRDIWIIRSFILSCTVLSRGIETCIIEYFLEKAKEQGVAEVRAEVVETVKNKSHKKFYLDNGFEAVSKDGCETLYSNSLAKCTRTANWVTLCEPERRGNGRPI